MGSPFPRTVPYNKIVRLLFYLLLITAVIAFFRSCSSLNSVRVMTDPTIKNGITKPFNLPMIGPIQNHIRLIGIAPNYELSKKREFNIGYYILFLIFGEFTDRSVYISKNETVLISYNDSPIELRFTLDNSRYSLGGHWTGENGRVITTGLLNGTFNGTPYNEKSIGISGVSSSGEWVSPKFEATIPINNVNLKENLDQRRIRVAIEMDVTVPKPGSRISTYREDTSSVTSQFEMIVLSPSESSEYNSILEKYLSKRKSQLAIVWGPILGGEVMLLVCVYAIYRMRHKKQKGE